MKIKQFIVTYDNEIQINEGLDSIFKSLSEKELSILEIYIINNHSKLNIKNEFLNKIQILNNQVRPDFSTGHLSRNWNECIINGFKNLNNPDCDIVIANQEDTIFENNYIDKLIELHNKFDLIQMGTGDNFISYTPYAVKRIGLWDERFCNIGYQEMDFFTRAALYLREKSTLSPGFMCLNSSHGVKLLKYKKSGSERGEYYHGLSSIYHGHSFNIYLHKWGMPFWEALDIINNKLEKIEPKINSYIFYPYFEKDIETLMEQKYIYIPGQTGN